MGLAGGKKFWDGVISVVRESGNKVKKRGGRREFRWRGEGNWGKKKREREESGGRGI